MWRKHFLFIYNKLYSHRNGLPTKLLEAHYSFYVSNKLDLILDLLKVGTYCEIT